MSTSTVKDVFKFIDEKGIRFIDFRFTDTRGKEQHISTSRKYIDESIFSDGKMFDGSSIAGWKNISSSDMILMPDPTTSFLDPFFEEPTLVLRCNVIDPTTMKPYTRDPRSVAFRAAEFVKSTGIADVANFGPEPEFFIFDSVRFKVSMDNVFFHIDSEEAEWNCGTEYDYGNFGHRPRIKGGYFPVPPVDSSQDMRSAICVILEDLGISVETHHHEVATAGQAEIDIKYDNNIIAADHIMMLKYVVHNVAHAYGKTATFMPKPLVGDNGSGMHCHQSLSKGGKNLFAGDGYGGLSQLALHYIGGIIKHAKALNAFTNPATNSYKRLVPGFEAPVMLSYSALNRSAAIRVPYVPNEKGRRIEVRFPDPLANPYLAFSAMLMAGLDGIKHKIDPGRPIDKNLYELSLEESARIPTVCGSLQEAIAALKADYHFLLEGGVFNEDLLEGFVDVKMKEITRLAMTTHPVEFDMYYSD